MKFDVNGRTFELASQDRIEALEHIAPRFFEQILGKDYYSCLITDESDLSDFEEEDLEIYFERIEEEYFRDLREVGSTRIVDLLEALSYNGVSE